MVCVSEGANRAASEVYRVGITAIDPVDLTNPLAKDLAPASFNAGLQPNKGTTLIVSAIFDLGTGSVTLCLVNWGRDKDQNDVAVSVRQLPVINAGSMKDPDTGFFGGEALVPVNAGRFELRVVSITDEVTKLRAWTY